MNNEVVSIDLGSNSFRVLKYDGLKHKILAEHNEVVGMADGLIDTGLISNEAQNRVITAIKKSIEIIDYDPFEAIAVTTAAMRNAKNNKEVLKKIYDEVGVSFKIIDGKEEARLTLLAVKYALKREKIDTSKFILLDIGGGSTEIIVYNNEKYVSHSFDFGIVTMTQKYLQHQDLQSDLENRKKEILSFLSNEGYTNLDDKN